VRDALTVLRLSMTRRGILLTEPIERPDRPVLLIYGFFQNRRILSVLHDRLKRDRFSVFTIHLGGLLNTFNTHGIPTLAALVRDEVESLCRETGIRRLAIVGHSEGGLVARYYVKKLGGHRRVTHLVTLGTPHHGTPVAYLGILTLGALARSVWQMTPMSPFIRELKSGKFPRACKLTTVYSKTDRIAPYPCCMLELKPGERTSNVEIDDVGHVAMLLSKHVYEVVRAELLDEVNLRARGKGPGFGRIVSVERAPASRAADRTAEVFPALQLEGAAPPRRLIARRNNRRRNGAAKPPAR
jgi:triacylglycerol esterase/lipase EstA (alpha/beta hydrolase family)